jgi:sorting nexin-29
LEKQWEFNRESWHVFIDFKQAYDSIHRRSLWSVLSDFGLPGKLIRLVQLCYEGTRCRVRVGGELTQVFEVKSGLRQG